MYILHGSRRGYTPARTRVCYLTISCPTIPASLWPGTSHSMLYVPAAGAVKVLVTVWPGSIVRLTFAALRTQVCWMLPMFFTVRLIVCPGAALIVAGSNLNSAVVTVTFSEAPPDAPPPPPHATINNAIMANAANKNNEGRNTMLLL